MARCSRYSQMLPNATRCCQTQSDATRCCQMIPNVPIRSHWAFDMAARACSGKDLALLWDPQKHFYLPHRGHWALEMAAPACSGEHLSFLGGPAKNTVIYRTGANGRSKCLLGLALGEHLGTSGGIWQHLLACACIFGIIWEHLVNRLIK